MATPGEGLERAPPTEGSVLQRMAYAQGVVSHPQRGSLSQSAGDMYLQRGLFHHIGWRTVPLTEQSVQGMGTWSSAEREFLCLLSPHPSDARVPCPLTLLSCWSHSGRDSLGPGAGS